MAIFEHNKAWRKKVAIDDTEALSVVFESTQNVQGHTVRKGLSTSFYSKIFCL